MTAPKLEIHPVYGPAMPEANWIPAPRFLLRRDRILRSIASFSPCRVLDIGCGPATILSEIADLGFDAVGVDRSEDALKLASGLISRSRKFQVYSDLDPAWKGTFDILCSFEVIEHLDDDIGALREWRQYLKPGGTLLVSTPAHPSRWNAADEWAGHVRRYTRDDVVTHLEQAGYRIDKIECYGFPLANLMERWRARVYGRQMQTGAKADKDDHSLTDESGSDRSFETRFWTLFSSWPAVLAMRAACQFQRVFLNTNLGNGWFVVARAV